LSVPKLTPSFSANASLERPVFIWYFVSNSASELVLFWQGFTPGHLPIRPTNAEKEKNSGRSLSAVAPVFIAFRRGNPVGASKHLLRWKMTCKPMEQEENKKKSHAGRGQETHGKSKINPT
jgi:hypothetical protein